MRRLGLRRWSLLAILTFVGVSFGDEIDRKYPLDAQLRVLSEDVKNPKYRKLVVEAMLITDLAAEWQRVATADNPESFLEKHGGKEKALADPDLKRAYDRRVEIRDAYLNLMREGYARYKKKAPFDLGVKAEPAGSITRPTLEKSAKISVVLPSPGAEKQWPRFRGPGGQGVTAQTGLPIEWDRDGRNILWRAKAPGAGNSSPVIWDDHLFLTSSQNKGTERYVHCYRRSDGQLRWSRQVPARPPEPGVREKNGYASATPVVDGERVIAFLGSCGLVCYDFDGNLLWKYDDLSIKTTHGTGVSPLLYKNLVILAQDQNQADSIFLALDKNTGQKVWQGKRSKAMTWSTPIVVRVGDRDELVMAGNGSVRGYDPNTGTELWSFNGPTVEVVPTLVISDDVLISASGRNGPTLAFRPGGKGDVTKSHFVWRAVRGGPHVPSPALVNKRVYIANDTGIFSCFDAQDGKLIYSERENDRFSASPLVAGDRMYFCGESGITYVVRAGDQLEILARNDLGAPLLASPAAMDNRLYLRAGEELFCIGTSAR